MKMTDNEIKKALECCRVEGHCTDECPYYSNLFKGKAGCLDEKEGIIPKALDLINRQQAEIERLEGILGKRCEKCTAKIEAYKEFAERLKVVAYVPDLSIVGEPVVDVEDIDDLLAEMESERNA